LHQSAAPAPALLPLFALSSAAYRQAKRSLKRISLLFRVAEGVDSLYKDCIRAKTGHFRGDLLAMSMFYASLFRIFSGFVEGICQKKPKKGE